MDLYQSYSLFSFLVRSNAEALSVSQGKKNWGGGWKEKAKMAALMLQMDATFRRHTTRGQWRFGRYALPLGTKNGALFREGSMTTSWFWHVFTSCFHLSAPEL